MSDSNAEECWRLNRRSVAAIDDGLELALGLDRFVPGQLDHRHVEGRSASWPRRGRRVPATLCSSTVQRRLSSASSPSWTSAQSTKLWTVSRSQVTPVQWLRKSCSAWSSAVWAGFHWPSMSEATPRTIAIMPRAYGESSSLGDVFGGVQEGGDAGAAAIPAVDR